MKTGATREFIAFEIYRHYELIQGTVKQNLWENLFINNKTGYYMILFAGKTGVTHYIDDHAVYIKPYSVLFVGPDRQSRFSKESSESTHILVFSSVFYNRTARDAHSLTNNPLFYSFDEVYQLTPPEEAISYCKGLASLLHTAKENEDNPLSEDLAHNIIEQILILGTIYGRQDLNSCFRSNQDQLLVIDFKKALKENYRDHTKVKYYADKLHVTERRLSKATSKILNQTAKEVITDHVMNEARWRLANRPDNIKVISAYLGFSEEHNFSAFFKKNENISPLQFRRKYQNKTVIDG